MPLILPERITDRTATEAAAVAFQKRAAKHTKPIKTALASLMRMHAPEPGHLARGIKDHDLTLVLEAMPQFDRPQHIPMTKADTPTDTPESRLAENVAATFTDSATFAISLMPKFDLVDQHAVDFAREQAGRFLSDLDERALANAREAVAFGIEHGRTVESTANFLSAAQYLPDRGMNAVENYFLGLIDQVEKGKDLAEAARAEGAGRALSPMKFLDATNIDTLVDRYAARWVDYTAESVARTMTIEASNAGLVDGWTEAASHGLFDASTAMLVWYATEDELTCPECEDLDGQECAFDGGDFGGIDYPPAHPSCRCTVVLITPDGVESDVSE